MSRITTTVVTLLLAATAFGQAKEDAGDGKKLDKQTMEWKDYLPEINGTIRGNTNSKQKQRKVVLKYVTRALVFREMCILWLLIKRKSTFLTRALLKCWMRMHVSSR